jgi:hypothetical protein
MEAKAKAGEDDLSMEEILQSIRKIIAEDGDETSAVANGAATSASDVLELTEMVEEAPAAPAASAPAASASQDEINDILNKIDQVIVPEPVAVAAAPVPQQTAPAASVVLTRCCRMNRPPLPPPRSKKRNRWICPSAPLLPCRFVAEIR